MNAKDRLRGLTSSTLAWSKARMQEAAPKVVDALRTANSAVGRVAGRTVTIVVDAVRERGAGDGSPRSHEPDDPGARKP